MHDRWLNVHEAAEYVGLSDEVMRERMPGISGATRTKIGTGDWRVKASMLDAWLATNAEARRAR